MSFYGADLAHVHDDGFGGFARDAAPGILRLLARAGVRDGLVVDLGCGSGIWASLLVEAGYDVLGIDASADLVRIARRRAPGARFVVASLDEVELPSCRAVTALGEVLSYGPRESLAPVVARIADALQPGGVLAFDVVGPGREPRPRRTWTEGDGWVVCVDVREEDRVVTRRIVTFRRTGRTWRRSEETHRQRAFSRDEVLAALAAVGLRGRARRGYGGAISRSPRARSSFAAVSAVDISSQDFWALPRAERSEVFAALRRDDPLSWHDTPESVLVPPELTTGGYWAAVRYADVRHVSRNAKLFRSGNGVLFEDAPPETLEASQSFLAMDAPRHTKVRGLVNAAFTPRQVRQLEDGIAAHAREIVDRLLEEREGDFVQTVSRELPMRMIAQMIGVPESDRDAMARAADAMVSWADPEFVGDRHPAEVIGEGLMALTAMSLELAAHREADPADDLMTALVQAEVDGEKLTHQEIAAFFVLLSVAGNDTTRHTTTHTAVALQDYPDQRALLADGDADMETAVEEFVRWATPVMTFRRTATQDTEIDGHPVAEGEKVVMFYVSANRDETAFDEPERFDVARSPNHHVGFGGGGPHYCLGASFARTQLRTIFTELLERAPSLQVGEPEPLVGNFIDGVKRLPYSL